MFNILDNIQVILIKLILLGYIMKAFNTRTIIFFILILNIPAGMSVDLFTPSLPAMVKYFHVSDHIIQWTVSIYLLVLAISQWICGYLSDHYGRKPVLNITAIIFLVGSLECIFATHFWVILLGRLLQGIGAGISSMISAALMNEALEEKQVPKVANYFSLSYSMIPIIAPFVGGILQHAFGWQANFVFMFIVTAIIMSLAFFKLPETRIIDKKTSGNLKLFKLFSDSIKVLCNLKYIKSVLGLVLLWSTIPVFSILGPFILQNLLHQSASVYGIYALLIGLGFFCGNLVNGILLRIMNHSYIVLSCLIFVVIVSIIQWVLIASGFLSVLSIMISSFLLMVGIGASFPVIYGSAVTAEKQLVGIASALIGFLICLGAAIITFVIPLFESHSGVTLPISFFVLTALSLLLQFVKS